MLFEFDRRTATTWYYLNLSLTELEVIEVFKFILLKRFNFKTLKINQILTWQFRLRFDPELLSWKNFY